MDTDIFLSGEQPREHHNVLCHGLCGCYLGSTKRQVNNRGTITVVINVPEDRDSKLELMIYVMCYGDASKVKPLHGDPDS